MEVAALSLESNNVRSEWLKKNAQPPTEDCARRKRFMGSKTDSSGSKGM